MFRAPYDLQNVGQAAKVSEEVSITIQGQTGFSSLMLYMLDCCLSKDLFLGVI